MTIIESPTVRLSSQNMGDASEGDYDSWVAFVAANIVGRCGFRISVEAERYGGIVSRPVSNASDAEKETITEALEDLWLEWCDGDGQPEVDHG